MRDEFQIAIPCDDLEPEALRNRLEDCWQTLAYWQDSGVSAFKLSDYLEDLCAASFSLQNLLYDTLIEKRFEGGRPEFAKSQQAFASWLQTRIPFQRICIEIAHRYLGLASPNGGLTGNRIWLFDRMEPSFRATFEASNPLEQARMRIDRSEEIDYELRVKIESGEFVDAEELAERMFEDWSAIFEEVGLADWL